jgi:hemerythrin-like domain-containing protein
MKRDPALRSLSSEHHTGLVIARRARLAASESEHAKFLAWEEVTSRFHGELEAHFVREEEGLLPALREVGETALVERTLQEHSSLRRLIKENRPDNLAAFSELLTAHIRFEEKELFETAQKRLPPMILAKLEDTPVSRHRK